MQTKPRLIRLQLCSSYYSDKLMKDRLWKGYPRKSKITKLNWSLRVSCFNRQKNLIE